jgi:EAL domain-containing protein (putative c-di-GMP-specific phosphodiesterase class I)
MITFLEEPMIFDGRIASVSVSVGIVDLESDDATVEEIIRRADVAMYAAKSDGRNRTHVYQKSLDFKRDENRKIALELRQHIEKGNLTVVYQPIVDARTRRTKGVEALVRWPTNASKRYSPDVFIPVAEEFGLIEDLGRFVMKEACRQSAMWSDIFVSVNVSPIQFMNPNFAELVAAILAETGLDAKRLELEVTEGFIIDNASRADTIINRLHDMNVRVALDDFGTGFSSIGHLRRFKFDKLKLDRSMVTDILHQPSALRLVQGTIAMADALGLTVVAEGIEHENQVSVLRLAGCNQFQGYLFSKPVEAGEITAFLQDGSIALAG